MVTVYTPDCVPAETLYPTTVGSLLGSQAMVSVAASTATDIAKKTATIPQANRAARFLAMPWQEGNHCACTNSGGVAARYSPRLHGFLRRPQAPSGTGSMTFVCRAVTGSHLVAHA